MISEEAKQKRRQYAQIWRAKNRNHYNAYMRKFRANNLEYEQKYREENKDKFREINKRSYAKNYDKRRGEAKLYREQNKTKLRVRDFATKYKLSLDDAQYILDNKPNVCDICQKGPSDMNGIVYDHCHVTGVQRGWLCGHCNKMLGYARDNALILQAAIQYLTQKELIWDSP